MPLTETDPNISFNGRNSRSSTSNVSASLKDARRPSAAIQSELLSNAPSVLSMLKTTTETGDLGSLSIPHSRLPKLPRSINQRPNAPSRTSSHYSRTASIRSKTSNNSITDRSRPSMPGSWPSKQHIHARSHDNLHQSSDGRPNDASEKRRKLSRSTSDQLNPEQRSYSLVHSLHPIHRLNNQRSVASLRSESPLHGPRSPYRHPTRLRHPNHRPASPAYSDTQGTPYNRSYVMRPNPAQHGPSVSSIPNHMQSNRDGIVHAPMPRYHHPGQESEGSFASASRTLEACHTAPVNMYRNEGASYMQQNYNVYNRPAQTFKATPSPLRDGYSRFGNPHPVDHVTPQAPAYGGFVQRVKNILEERASLEDTNCAQRFSSPRAQADVTNVLPHRPQSPKVAKITRVLVKAAVGSPSDKEVIGSSEYQEPYPFQVQSETSSGEGSSVRANGSIDLPRTTSTPDVAGVRGGARSEVETSASSTDSPSPAIKFSLRSAVQEATAPTISDASQSLTDLIELPAESVQVHSEESGYTNRIERPFSFPQVFEPRFSDATPGRQSLPVPADLSKRSPPDFSFIQRADLTSLEQSQPLSDDRVDQIHAPLAAEATTIVHENSQVVGDAENAPDVSDKPLLLDYSQMQSDQSNILEISQLATPSNGVRSSVTRISVEPTKNENLPSPRNDRSSVASLSNSNRRTSPRDSGIRGSMAYFEAKATSSHNSFEGGDLRLSALKNFNFPMPDLTEDSQEDASTTNLRMLGARHPMFRSGGFRGAQDARPRHRSSAAPEPPSSYLSRKLANTRGIPSLNFSSTDLTATLNRALGLRSSRSLEDLRHSRTKGFRSSAGNSIGGTRTLSQGDAISLSRERYRSFFSEDNSSESGKEDAEVEEVTERSVPQEILAEIDRISIPSVNGLTVRISELIPTIKNCDSEPDVTKSDAALESTLHEIRELGSPARLASMDLKRASLISTMSAVANPVTENEQDAEPAIEERSPSQMAKLHLMKALPPLPIDIMSPRPSVASGSGRPPLGEETCSDVAEGPAELEATVPVEAPVEFTPVAIHDTPIPSSTKFRLKKASNRTLASTPDGRPWNKQASYPWVDEERSMDISMPITARDAGSPVPRQTSRLKHVKSVAEIAVDDQLRIVRSMSPGPKADAGLIPDASATNDPPKQVPTRKGPLGSLIRRIGIRPRVDKAGFPVDPHFFHPEGNAVTEPGDRYPTTGLTPPSGLNIGDNRSFFSDNSSENEEQPVAAPRKRLTRTNQKRSASRALTPGDMPNETPRASSALGHDDSLFEGSQVDATNPDVMVMMYDQPAVGMSKTEFRAKRMIEKFRTLWYRSGHFFRHLGHKKKQAPSWYEASELYAGT